MNGLFFLAVAMILVIIIAGLALLAINHEHNRSHPVVARESVMDDLDALLDTGPLPQWRVHQDAQKNWHYCVSKKCTRPHFQYAPFKEKTDG